MRVHCVADVYLDARDLPWVARLIRHKAELHRIGYHKARIATVSCHHFKSKQKDEEAMKVDPIR